MASPRNGPQGGQGSEWSGRMLDSEGLTLPHQLTNAPVAAISANDTRRAGRMPARPTPFAVSDDHKLSFWLALVRTRALALADQAVVSGTNFLTTIMIARWALPDELGIYAMAISLLVSWIAAQEALVLLPYTIHRHRPQATPTEHAGSYLALSGLFSVVAIAMFSMAALGLSTASAPHGLVAATLVLAVAVPFASLRALACSGGPGAGPCNEYATARRSSLACMDRPVVRHYRLRGDRRGVRRVKCRVALPFPRELCDPSGPVAQDDASKLATRKMAVSNQNRGVAACAGCLLAASRGHRYRRHGRLRRMHEHRISRQSNHTGAL